MGVSMNTSKQIIAVVSLVLANAAALSAANYYVDGSVAASGNGQSAASAFKTIGEAASRAQAGDVVYIKAGAYCESVKPANSGSAGNPITFRNYPGEAAPTICAGDKITSAWTLDANGIYWASCAWGRGQGMNQVVCNGDLMIEAREPNISGKEELAETRRLGKMFGGSAGSGDILVYGASSWGANFWNGGVVWGAFGNNWACQSAAVTSSQSSGANHQVFLGAKTDQWWFTGGGSCFLTGVKGALDADKEFFLDEAAHRLYLRAPGGVNPSSMAVYVKNRTTVIDMSTRNYVVFDSVNTMMGGITMNDATNCALRNGRHLYSCHFYRFSGGRGDNPLGTTTDDPAACAVYVSGENNSIEGCEIAYAATGVRLEGRNHVVRNTTIHDIYGGNYFSNIFIACMDPVGSESGGHLIERCTIAKSSRALIHWTSCGNGTSTYTKSRILYNDLSDFNEFTNDGGAIYSYHVYGSGTEIAYNWIHGERGSYGRNNGIYWDNETADFRSHHNVMWDLRFGFGWNAPSDRHEAYNNTIWSRSGDENGAMWFNGGSGCKTYNNLSNESPFGGNDLQKNLTTTTPNFVGNPNNPTSGLDFRLQSNSPAVNYGIAIAGITDGSVGAPDAGAYEYGGAENVSAWTAGAWSGRPPEFTSVSISPSYTAVKPGASLQFTAQAADQYGAPLSASFTWSVVGGGTINASGLYTAGTADGTTDTVRARATIAGVTRTGSATAIVTSQVGITKIRFYPRAQFANRMTGGTFEGSNGDKTAGPYITIARVTSQPAEAQWNEITTFEVPNPVFRYVRYSAPSSGWGNVSEIEFYSGNTKLTGQVFGTPGSFQNSGNDYTKAFDGNIATFFDYSAADGAYTGLDLEGATVAPQLHSSLAGMHSAISMLNGRIAISSPGPHMVRITNALGAVVRTITGNGPKVYDLSGELSAGVYLVCARAGGRSTIWRQVAGHVR
jgi:hypothetical protein